MARTAGFSFALGVLIAWNWGRLESPHTRGGPLLLMIVLGVAPALLPSLRLRLVGATAALLVAASIALDTRPYDLGAIVSRTGRGFLDFYDVLVPFAGSEHGLMHGVLLLAVFVFTALAALAVAARRPLLASLVLVTGAGWPATIFPGHDDLGRGVLLLAAALALVARLGPTTRRGAPQILVGTGLAVVALIASSWSGVAKAQFLDWQNWDLSTKTGPSVSVEYVWKANYRGIKFPEKRTRVLTVRAPARSVYWRATTLDTFIHDAWEEDLIPALPFQFQLGEKTADTLTDDPLLPAAARESDNWTSATVHVDALRDRHAVSPSGPVAYENGRLNDVSYYEGGVATVSGRPLSRGTQYSAWAYQPQPRPSQLAKSPPHYPASLVRDWRYLEVGQRRVVPPFGAEVERARWFRDAFDDPQLRPYRPLFQQAESIAGDAKNPYAATVAIELWLRSSGGFDYDERPRQVSGMPPLVAFVTRTKSGYCQHFAGAMALMLRYLGIPARVAAGFTSGAYDADRGTWRVNDRNAHTWVEVWFDGYGWLPFDPTPGRGNLGGSYTTSSISFDALGTEKVLQASIGAAAAGTLLQFQLGSRGRRIPGDNQATGGDVAKGRGGNAPGPGVAVARLALLGLVGLVVLFVVAKLILRRSRFLTSDPRSIATACRRELVGYLLDVGITIPRNLGLAELGTVVRKRTGVDSARLVESMGVARFGPPTASAAAAREARSELRAVRRRLRRAIPFGRRARGLFSLRSLLAS
jgi:transglutaminase-like putative cysteine protease